MSDGNRTTEGFVTIWSKARERVKSLEKDLTKAKNELIVAATNLGNHMTPKDAKADEKFSLWVNGESFNYATGDVLLEIHVVNPTTPEYFIDVSRRPSRNTRPQPAG